jgi:hypothetical protein
MTDRQKVLETDRGGPFAVIGNKRNLLEARTFVDESRQEFRVMAETRAFDVVAHHMCA